MNFGAMFEWLSRNKSAIAERPGWNGAFIAYVPEKKIAPELLTSDAKRLIEQHAAGGAIALDLAVPSYFVRWTAPNTLEMGWTPTTAELFADDWAVFKDAETRAIT